MKSKKLAKAAQKALFALQEVCEALDSFKKVKGYGVPKMKNIPPTPKKKIQLKTSKKID